MVRWLLIGALVVGVGQGLRQGWLEWHGEKFRRDLNLPGRDWNERLLDAPDETPGESER
jgi:hypothetical protein